MLIFSNHVLLVIDGHSVLVKRNGNLIRLDGPEVKQILIPLLPELEKGLDVETNSVFKNLNQDKANTILDQLLKADLITLCGACAIDKNSDCVIDVSNKLFSLGVIGSDKLYEELVTTFASYPSWEVKNLTILESQQVKECTIVVFVNNGLDNSKTLSLAKQLYTEGVRFINVSLNEEQISVGPYVEKGIACLDCYNARRISNLTYGHEAKLFATADRIYGSTELHDMSVCNAKFIAGLIMKQCIAVAEKESIFHSPLQEKIITFNLSTLNIKCEEFFRNPRCNVCGCSSTKPTEVKQWSVNPFSNEKK